METNAHTLDRTVAFCVFVLVLLLGLMRIWETDAWWHLSTGRLIAETQQLPKTDTLSFTQEGKSWTVDEWLGGVYLYGFYQRHGAGGVVVAVALMGACVFFLVLGAARIRGVPAAAAALPVAIAAVASRTRITPRPEIFALLLTSLFLYILAKYLNQGDDDARARKFLWLLPPLQILWVNFHNSGILGVTFTGLAIASAVAAFFLNTGRDQDKRLLPHTDSRSVRRLGLIFILCLGASLINPYTFKALTIPFQFATHSAYLSFLTEWVPVPAATLLSPLAGSPQVLCFKILILAAAAGLVLRFRKQNLFDTALLLFTFYMALRAQRFIALFAIAATPGIAANLYHAARSVKWFSSDSARRLAAPACSLVVVALALIGWRQLMHDPRILFGTGVDTRRFPEAAMQFVEDAGIRGRMYNDYGLGGWIIWKLGPERKVFIDGRTHFYGETFFSMNHRFEAHPSAAAWDAVQKRYAIDYAILSPKSPHQKAVFYAIMAGGDWRLVFWDQRAMVLIRDIPRFRGIAARYSYALAGPYTYKKLIAQWNSLRSGERDRFMAEMKRSLDASPSNTYALWTLAYLAEKTGDMDRAETLATRGVKADAREADLHALLGQIALKRNDPSRARRHFETAARMDPRYKEILKQLK